MRKTSTQVALLVAAGMLTFVGCTAGDPAPTAASPSPTEAIGGFPLGSTIGVSATPWGAAQAELLGEGLAEAGFIPDVRYPSGDDAVAEQQAQIMAMIDEGARVIFVSPVDARRLSEQLEVAEAAGITIIGYNRLVHGTDAVDYVINFDGFQIGELQGQALLDGLAERAPGNTSWNIEIFSGSTDDSNSAQFLDGALSVLQPRIDDGTLVVVSGQTSTDLTSTASWDPENARKRMDTLLTDYYSGMVIDGVLAPNDSIASSIFSSCQEAGRPIPVITGQDSTPDAVTRIMAGEQYSTIYKDNRRLVAQAVTMVSALQAGIAPEINDTTQSYTGVIIVPAYLLDGVLVTADNAEEVYRDDPTLFPLTQP